MTTTFAPVCYKCKHYLKDSANPPKCKAFPSGIPEEIFDGLNKHKEKYPGDHGIQYEHGEPQLATGR